MRRCQRFIDLLHSKADSTQLNIETKCSMFQLNVTFQQHCVIFAQQQVTFSHEDVKFSLNIANKSEQNYTLNEILNTFLLEEIVIISLKSASKIN